jgi:hypothetical protein
MGAMTAETKSPGLIGAESHAGTPSKSSFVAGNLLDAYVSCRAGDALQLFGYARSLEITLCLQGDMLKVATATASRTGMRTWRQHPIG